MWGDYKIGYNEFGYFQLFFVGKEKCPHGLNLYSAVFFFVLDEAAVGEES